MVRELNVDAYRFSLSWSRILPTGFPDKVNKQAISYYNGLIDELLRHNITPIITIYHWDLPQRLQEMGGWTNEKIIGWFKDYADIVFTHFSDRVQVSSQQQFISNQAISSLSLSSQWWTTINEPYHVCVEGYGKHYMAPGYTFPGIPGYLCAHNLLLAHAVTVDMFRSRKLKGKIGITIDAFYYEPKSPGDQELVEQALQFYVSGE